MAKQITTRTKGTCQKRIRKGLDYAAKKTYLEGQLNTANAGKKITLTKRSGQAVSTFIDPRQRAEYVFAGVESVNITPTTAGVTNSTEGCDSSSLGSFRYAGNYTYTGSQNTVSNDPNCRDCDMQNKTPISVNWGTPGTETVLFADAGTSAVVRYSYKKRYNFSKIVKGSNSGYPASYVGNTIFGVATLVLSSFVRTVNGIERTSVQCDCLPY